MIPIRVTQPKSDAESSDGQSPSATRKGKKAKTAGNGTPQGDENMANPRHSAVYRCCQTKGPEPLDNAIMALETMGFMVDPVTTADASFARFLRLQHSTECPRILDPTDKTMLIRDDTF